MSNPTNGVWQFDGDLDGDTQSGTASFTMDSGPERYDGGLWLEEGTTNLAQNPSVESGLSPWDRNAGVETVTQDATEAYIGTKSAKLVAAGAADFEGLLDYSLGGLGLTGSARVFTASVQRKGSGEANLCFLRIDYNDASNTSGGASTVQLTGDWERAVHQVTANPAKTINFLTLYTARDTVRQAFTAFADALQIEEKPYATSYADLSMGAGYSDGGSGETVRAASSASVPTAGIISPVAGAIAFRLTPTIETGVEEIWGECGVKGAGTDHVQWGRDASKHPFVEWSSNDAAYTRLTATETIDAGTQAFIYLGHDGTDITLQVNAGSLQADTRNAVEDDFSTGDLTLQASAGGVLYDDFATFDRTLTAKEITQVRRASSFSFGMFGGNPYIHFQLRPY